MAIIIPANSAADAAFSVDNSCRFNDDDSAYMHKTPGSGGNRRTFTFSSWVKRGDVEADEYAIFTGGVDANAAGFFTIMFDDNNKIDIQCYDGGWDNVTTTRVFRDPAAWYHIVVAVDTTQGVAANRIKIYVNGVQETSFSSVEYPAQDLDLNVNHTAIMTVGVRRNSSAALAGYLDAYLAETVLIDGTQYAASDFGEFDEDSPTIWKPKDVSELTFGTNGFYLDYEASDNLGNDANGGTDLTEVNLAAVDQATDTPTNNFATFNPLNVPVSATPTFSQGNCVTVSQVGAGLNFGGTSTLGMTAGKWYWECSPTSVGNGSLIGATGRPSEDARLNDFAGHDSDSYSYVHNGNKMTGNSESSFDNTYTDGDIISVALDITNLKIYFAKNGTWQNSGDPTSGATGTGAAFTITASASTLEGVYAFSAGDYGNGGTTFQANFGGCPALTVSSAVADENDYGAFEYAPPSGYLALCTKNLGSDGG